MGTLFARAEIAPAGGALRPAFPLEAAVPSDVSSSGSRIVNASVRAVAGGGENTLIAGFVIAGEGRRPVMLRGVGPGLVALGVRGALADPVLELHDIRTSRVIAADRGWCAAENFADVSIAAVSLGAFPLTTNSADSALLIPLGAGVYTANAFGASGQSGVALVELYEGEAANSTRLVNLSARTHVGTGEDILILGFVISGTTPKRVLVRGVGPSLAGFGVNGLLADPRLELRNATGTLIASNEDWGGATLIREAAATVGAFPLATDTRDAALLATLAPGAYTVHILGAAGSSGVALAELYDVPLAPETRWTMVNVSPNNEQADCHLIELPDGRNVLIDIADAADAGGSALAFLQSRGITQVDLVVLSHFHVDHYGRLRDLLSAGVKVGAVAFNLPSPEDVAADAEAPWGFSRADATSLIQLLRDRRIPCFTPHAGDRLIETRLPDGTTATLDVVCLFDGAHTPVGITDTNDTSIVLRLSHGSRRVLFTGDLNAALGGWLARSDVDLAADLLKVPHHGTEGAAPNAFFDRVHAQAVLVPSPAGLWQSERSRRIRDYFAAQHTPAYVSGSQGHVTVTLNARGYTIIAERPLSP